MYFSGLVSKAFVFEGRQVKQVNGHCRAWDLFLQYFWTSAKELPALRVREDKVSAKKLLVYETSS